jgi:hypothetical protein
MAPILAPILGVHFFGGIFPSKMGSFAPFLATIQALSRARAPDFISGTLRGSIRTVDFNLCSIRARLHTPSVV